MTDHLPTVVPSRQLKRVGLDVVPVLIADAGEATVRRFIEFFTANIRNKHTREAYARAVGAFCTWCTEKGITLPKVDPVLIAGYIEELLLQKAKPTVKQHLAAIRMLFDWLVTGGILPFNPATSVRGPKYVVKRGKTLVLEGAQAQQLLDSIGDRKLANLRDRALIGLAIYSFARASAMLGMRVKDYYQGAGRQMRIRLHEKGGKEHDLPVHHRAVEYLDAYIDAAGIADDKKSPVFRSVDRSGKVTERVMARQDVWAMVDPRRRLIRLNQSRSRASLRSTLCVTCASSHLAMPLPALVMLPNRWLVSPLLPQPGVSPQ
jgi:integrase/recombinase XerD